MTIIGRYAMKTPFKIVRKIDLHKVKDYRPHKLVVIPSAILSLQK
jgi:hypothetical protein